MENEVARPVMHSPDGITLRDYVDARCSELQRMFDKSEAVLTLRLAAMNEIREAMRDQSGQFITRAEYDSKHESICRDQDKLEEEMAENRGKATQTSVNIAYAIAIVSLVVSVVLHFIP